MTDMAKLYFDLKEALRIAEATVVAPDHGDSFVDTEEGRKTGPALLWVKDQGSYLMSNAKPRPDDDVLYGRAFSPDGLLLKHPDDVNDPTWNDVWETARQICGGDDFAEYFELAELLPLMRRANAIGYAHFVVDVSPETVHLGMER